VRAAAVSVLFLLLVQPAVNSFGFSKPCCCSKGGSCPLKKNACSLRNLDIDSIASESRDISSPAELTFSLQPPLTRDAVLVVLITATREFSVPPDTPPPRV
jgi:hypothetical protein